MAPSDVKPELHGLAAGERPERADWTIPQAWENYSAEEHGVWKTLFERQTRLLPGHACDEFLAGMRSLPLSPHEIPDFRRLSDVLMERTGWEVVAVPGLVPDEVFFDHLAHRRFPAGQFIRKPHELDYLQEPDVFHDVFGHVPMLMHPVMADFIQAYGQGGLRALRLGKLPCLARVYWYTVEFGLVQQPEGLRLYGSGIASSRTERWRASAVAQAFIDAGDKLLPVGRSRESLAWAFGGESASACSSSPTCCRPIGCKAPGRWVPVSLPRPRCCASPRAWRPNCARTAATSISSCPASSTRRRTVPRCRRPTRRSGSRPGT